MNKVICAAVVASALALASGLWRRGGNSAAPPLPPGRTIDTVKRVSGRVGIDAGPEWVSILPPGAVATGTRLTASGQVLPDRHVRVTARCDLNCKPGAVPAHYYWRLDFLRRGPGGWEEA